MVRHAILRLDTLSARLPRRRQQRARGASRNPSRGDPAARVSVRWPAPSLTTIHSRRDRRTGQAKSSAHCFLHERADPCLFGGGQLRQREGDRPHGASVEVRLVAEAERRVPRVELLRALEEADDLAVLGIRGHPVPESRREGWRAGLDDRMEPLAHGAIRFRHLGDLREHGAFPVRLVRARAGARGRLHLLDALLHRGSFLVRESLVPLFRGGTLGGLLRVLHWRSPPLRVLDGNDSHTRVPTAAGLGNKEPGLIGGRPALLPPRFVRYAISLRSSSACRTAAYLGCSIRHFNRRIRNKLCSVRNGRESRFPRPELDLYINSALEGPMAWAKKLGSSFRTEDTSASSMRASSKQRGSSRGRERQIRESLMRAL